MYDSITPIDAAKAYSVLGYQIFPVHGFEDGKCTCGKADCDRPAKHPLTANGCKNATADPEAIERYWSGDFGIANVGIATGNGSGLWTVDVDGETGAASLAAFEAEHGPLPKTVTVETGSGGTHYYFRVPPTIRIRNSQSKIGPGIDVRGEGGYVIAPPSVHASGGRHSWLVSPSETPLADAPTWLLDKAAAEASTLAVKAGSSEAERALAYLEKCPGAVSGQGGHNVTFATVCRLAELFPSLDEDALADVLASWNARCEPPWSDQELRHKARQAIDRVSEADDDVPEDVPEADPDAWPVMDEDAYHGLAGEFVRFVEPLTEADPVALLTTYLITFRNTVGRSPHYRIGGDTHHANVFATFVGKSSRARKGTSEGCVRAGFYGIETGQRISGLSTGEGLINIVRDDSALPNADKRVLVTEPEFARLLKAMARKENTLSPILRDAWDRGTLNVLTKTNPLTASGCHISIISHVTRDELNATLTGTDAVNGFGNRFLWCLVKRSKLLPDAGALPAMDDLRERLTLAVRKASSIGQMRRSEAASALWRAVYPELVAEKTGCWDAVTSRAEAQTLRLSMIYALLDASDAIEEPHLRTCMESVVDRG